VGQQDDIPPINPQAWESTVEIAFKQIASKKSFFRSVQKRGID